MKKINLSKNKKTIVDDKDYIFLKKFKWHTYHEKKNETYYARRMERDSNHRRVPCFLHWIVKGHPLKGYVIDHVNGNTLDNRRENLRIVSHSANMRNTYKHRAGKLMGTSYHKKAKNGKHLYVWVKNRNA